MDQKRNEELRATSDRAVRRDPSGRIARSVDSRKRWLVIGVLLIVAAGSLGYWFLRGTGRSDLAGRPVPAPDFDATSPSVGGAPRHPPRRLRPPPGRRRLNRPAQSRRNLHRQARVERNQ